MGLLRNGWKVTMSNKYSEGQDEKARPAVVVGLMALVMVLLLIGSFRSFREKMQEITTTKSVVTNTNQVVGSITTTTSNGPKKLKFHVKPKLAE